MAPEGIDSDSSDEGESDKRKGPRFMKKGGLVRGSDHIAF